MKLLAIVSLLLLCGCPHRRPKIQTPDINLCGYGTKHPNAFDECVQRLNGVS